MKKKLRLILLTVMCLCLIGGVTGCAVLDDTINEIKGNLVGNGYTIRTYDNYGSKVMTTTGDKINIQGNPVKTTSYSSDGSVVIGYEMSSVITINIDGKEIQSCGDTCIFEQDGLQPDVDFVQTDIYSQSTGKLSDNTYVAGIVNKYRNYFGKARVVVIKSQLGQPIVAYSGDEVYWKIPKDLPKMTKLMIDGKALYIHRANFQIIDTALLDQEESNMKPILLVDILAILRNNETIYLYESPNNSIGSFRVDRLLVYFSDSAILNREVKLIETTASGLICITLKSDKEK